MLHSKYLAFVLVGILALVAGAPPHEGRIAGGDVAREYQFPYQAGLSVEFVAGQFNWCGGSLIADRWILTAAHCVENVKSIRVHLGSTKRLEPAMSLRLTEVDVRLHPHFNNVTLLNDIALLHLWTAVPRTPSMRAIKLPQLAAVYSTYVYREAIASGWGSVSDASTAISNELRYVVRYVDSNAECQRIYGPSVRPTHLCIDTTGGRSTCTGDSGGPLVVPDAADGAVLIGLTSFGKSSGCTKGHPAVFTRVTSYLDWIYAISGVANLGK